MERLVARFQECGWEVYPVAATLAVALAVALARAARLHEARGGITGVVDALLAVVRESGDLAPAIDACIATRSRFSRVLGAALVVAHRPLDVVRATLDAERRRAFARITARNTAFPTLATVAIALGALGTLTGALDGGFYCWPVDATSRSVMFLKSLSESMPCTALALLAAALCLGADAYLASGARDLEARLDDELARFANALAPHAPYVVHDIRGERAAVGYRTD